MICFISQSEITFVVWRKVFERATMLINFDTQPAAVINDICIFKLKLFKNVLTNVISDVAL